MPGPLPAAEVEAAPLGEVRDYAELLDILRARIAQLDVTFERLDDIAGLTSRHCSKLFSDHPARTLGLRSLGLVLGALGLKLLVVEDREQFERVRSRLVNHHPNNGPHNVWKRRQRVLPSA